MTRGLLARAAEAALAWRRRAPRRLRLAVDVAVSALAIGLVVAGTQRYGLAERLHYALYDAHFKVQVRDTTRRVAVVDIDPDSISAFGVWPWPRSIHASIVDKLRQVFERQKKLERELESLKAKAAGSATRDLAGAARRIGDTGVIAARVDGLDAKALRESVDLLKQTLADCVVLLASGAEGKVALVAGVSGGLLGRIQAGDLLAHVAGQINGRGGGRPDMAQGGGDDVPGLLGALAGLGEWVALKAA